MRDPTGSCNTHHETSYKEYTTDVTIAPPGPAAT